MIQCAGVMEGLVADLVLQEIYEDRVVGKKTSLAERCAADLLLIVASNCRLL